MSSLYNNQDIQGIVEKDHIPFGQAQSPGLFDYADKVDTMDFYNLFKTYPFYILLFVFKFVRGMKYESLSKYLVKLNQRFVIGNYPL